MSAANSQESSELPGRDFRGGNRIAFRHQTQNFRVDGRPLVKLGSELAISKVMSRQTAFLCRSTHCLCCHLAIAHSQSTISQSVGRQSVPRIIAACSVIAAEKFV